MKWRELTAERCQVWRGKKVQEGKRSVGYEAGTECHLTVGIITSSRPCSPEGLFTPETAGQTGGGGGGPLQRAGGLPGPVPGGVGGGGRGVSYRGEVNLRRIESVGGCCVESGVKIQAPGLIFP